MFTHVKLTDLINFSEHGCQERFPDPESLVEELHKSGFKAIWMLDPGIKNEKGYFAYDSGSEADVWVQTADGRPYVGMCLFKPFF